MSLLGPGEERVGGHHPRAIRVSLSLLSDSVSVNFPTAMETSMRLPLTTGAVGRAWQGPGNWTRTVSGVPAQPLPDAPTSLVWLCHLPQEQTPRGASHLLLGDVEHLTHGGTRTSSYSGGKLKRWG